MPVDAIHDSGPPREVGRKQRRTQNGGGVRGAARQRLPQAASGALERPNPPPIWCGLVSGFWEMAQRYILALDQGTTGSTAMVFDAAGQVRARGYAEFTQHYPRRGWVEHDAEEIWSVSLKVIKTALRAAKITARDVAAIGITNQRETVVVWDRRTGRPVHRAIVWQ